MKHPSSREMFRCWNELRGHRLVPERDQLDLAALRKVLGDSLVLSLDHAAGYPVRLAGTRVRALFGRELKTLPFISLWETSSRSLLHVFVTMAGEGSAPMVAEAVGRSEFAETTVEMLLLPLARGDAPDSRLIGVLAPPAVPSWLGRSPVGPLTLRCFRHVPAGSPPPVERPPRDGGRFRREPLSSCIRADASQPARGVGGTAPKHVSPTPGINAVCPSLFRSGDEADSHVAC